MFSAEIPARLFAASTPPTSAACDFGWVQVAQTAAPFVALIAVAVTAFGLRRSRLQHQQALAAADASRYREAAREALAGVVTAFHLELVALREWERWAPDYRVLIDEAVAAEKANEIRPSSWGRRFDEVSAVRDQVSAARQVSKLKMALSQLYFLPGSGVGEATVDAQFALTAARLSVDQIGDTDGHEDEAGARLVKADRAVKALALEVGRFARGDELSESARDQINAGWFGL